MSERPVKLSSRGGHAIWIIPSKVNAVDLAIPAPGDIVDSEGKPVPYSCIELDCGDGFYVVGPPDTIAGLLFPSVPAL